MQAAMDAALPFETFGVTLNPGHLIHHDEWLSLPIFPDSDLPLRSGRAARPGAGAARLPARDHRDRDARLPAPLSDTAGIVTPFMLAPRLALTLT
jgi:hypothetical protein